MLANPYETERLLAEYLLFHYGSANEILPFSFGPKEALSFPVRCVSECVQLDRLPAESRALDLGCAVGRASFELARTCSSVVGIDASQNFIDAARKIQQEGALPYDRLDEGELVTSCVARLPQGLDPGRAAFEVGDAEHLREDLGLFDVVLMANLIDRLKNPDACLRRLPSLLNEGGQLIVISPYTWMEAYTPRENWIGGKDVDGKPVTTPDGLRSALERDFIFCEERDLPFLIREHARKYQWSVAHATLWRRR